MSPMVDSAHYSQWEPLELVGGEETTERRRCGGQQWHRRRRVDVLPVFSVANFPHPAGITFLGFSGVAVRSATGTPLMPMPGKTVDTKPLDPHAHHHHRSPLS